MRRTIILFCLFCFSFAAVHAQNASQQEPKDSLPRYLKYPKLPAFNVLELDSSTIFNTYNIPQGKPIAIVFFDPNCKHCRASTGRLVRGMDSVKNVQFYFVTPIHDLSVSRNFNREFHLGDYKNIKIIGRDYEFFFMTNYGVRSLPDVAIYDAHKKFVKLIEGEFSASEIYKYVH
jgi:thioredoxin-related protein